MTIFRLRAPIPGFLVIALGAGTGGTISAQVAPSSPQVLSLAAAIALAEDASETVGIARAAVDRARGQQLQARSGYWPQLTGSATYTRTLRSQFSTLQDESDTTSGAPAGCRAFQPDPSLPIGERVDSLESSLQCLSNTNPFDAFRDLPFGREHQYSFGLSLAQTIFDRRLGGQAKSAAAVRRVAEIGLVSRRAQVIVDVTSAYYAAVLGDRLLSIAESTLVQAERTLGDIRLGEEVGTVAEFDLLRAQVTRDNQRPIVIQRRTDRDLAHLRLRQLLDLPLDAPLELTTELGDTGADGPGPGGASDTSVAANAAVRQSEELVRAAEGRRQVASGQQLPSLRLSSTYARIGFPPSTFELGDAGFRSDWSVALRLEVPLFTGGRIRGEKMAAAADLDEARLQLEQTREQAALGTRDLLARLEAAQAQWDASAGVVEQATRAYGIAEIRFREGISNQTELSDSRLLLQQAQANRAMAARDLQVARVRVNLIRDLPLGGLAGAAGTGR